MTRNEIIQRVRFYATKYGIDQAVAVEQIRTESGFNPNAKSPAPANAMGLAQFIPSTWAQYGRGLDPYDVEANLDAWGRLMRDLLNRFKGDYARALIAYHSGPGAVEGVLRNPTGNPKTTAYYKKILAQAGQAHLSASNAAAAMTPPPPTPAKGLMIFTVLVLLALATR